jgi:hypothetical protein
LPEEWAVISRKISETKIIDQQQMCHSLHSTFLFSSLALIYWYYAIYISPNSADKSPAWDANNRSVSSEISRLYGIRSSLQPATVPYLEPHESGSHIYAFIEFTATPSN